MSCLNDIFFSMTTGNKHFLSFSSFLFLRLPQPHRRPLDHGNVGKITVPLESILRIFVAIFFFSTRALSTT